MKVLMTGALGHIASRIVPLLAARHELLLTDLNAGEVAGLPVEPLDITDLEAVTRASKGVDAVVHLAIASARNFVKDRETFRNNQGECYLRFNEASIDVNVRGSYHVYEAAKQNGIGRVVYGSSLTVLLGAPRYEAVADDLRPRPSNFYAVTKLWGEQLAEYYARTHGMTIYCLRFGTPHPWKEHPQYAQWVAHPCRDWTFVTYHDLARAVDAGLTFQNGPAFGTYTVVSDFAGRRFDVSEGAKIGWQPGDFVERDGTVRPVTSPAGC